jgi:uncharacterized protein
MSISMMQASVEVFVPYLGNLAALLDRAAEHAEHRRIDPAVLLNMRIAPNMFNLARQVCEANRHVMLGCALLAGQPTPAVLESEADMAELKRRIGATIDYVKGLPEAAIEASAEREVVFAFRNGATRAFTGRSLLLTFTLPQFFFHVTTAYDIMRHAGVELIKKDFLGQLR